MRKLPKILFVLAVALCSSSVAFAGNGGEDPGDNADSSASIKSNIVIFKMASALIILEQE